MLVTYNGSSPTTGSVPVDSTNYSVGNVITILGNTGALTKTGYNFVGWTINSRGAGTIYGPGLTTTYTAGSSNITLYAKWASKDKNIKKSLVLKKDLPPVNDFNQHVVKYRIVSDDFNRVSAWSPIYYVEAEPVELITATISKIGVTNAPAGIVSITWTDPKLRPKYDIFIKVDSASSYSYHGTASGSTYTFPNTATSTIRVVIQPEGINKKRVSGLTLYESGIVSIP